jgi:hypothetical protein
MLIRFVNLYLCSSVVIFYFFSIIGCQNTKADHPTKNDLLLLAALYNYQQSQTNGDCKSQYKSMNSLYSTYAATEFVNYPVNCENIIIGDSTMDLARSTSNFYDKTKTLNYSISGNTACDYLYQMEAIKCYPKNVLIATGDGNGVLRKISNQVSIDTMKKVVTRVKEKWNANTIIIGIHPVLLTNENIAKNPVNAGVSQLVPCYINPLPIFGVTENEPPDSTLMLDQIHYAQSIYPKYKTQILNQCGLTF